MDMIAELEGRVGKKVFLEMQLWQTPKSQGCRILPVAMQSHMERTLLLERWEQIWEPADVLHLAVVEKLVRVSSDRMHQAEVYRENESMEQNEWTKEEESRKTLSSHLFWLHSQHKKAVKERKEEPLHSC